MTDFILDGLAAKAKLKPGTYRVFTDGNEDMPWGGPVEGTEFTVSEPGQGGGGIGEKGDKGDPGAAVTGPQGSAGATGEKGAGGATGAAGAPGGLGPAGNALAYGHIVTSGSDQDTSGSTAVGLTFSHPGGSVWCLNPGGQTFTSLTVSADKPNAGAAVTPPGGSANSCASGRWQVITWLSSGGDAEASAVGFFYTAN